MTTPASGRALGRLSPKRAPALRLALTGRVPDHPAAADHFARVSRWVLGGNDRFGTCGPTGAANSRLLTLLYLSGAVFTPTDEDVFDLYRRSGNPDFDPETGAGDNGVDLQTMLEAMHSGGLAGTKPVCFAQVDHTNLDEVRAAEAIFGSVLLGVVLDTAQQAQTDEGLWDYASSAVWGGHAVLSGRYTDDAVAEASDRTGVVTWAEVVDTTDRFLDLQLEEAWVIIWPEHLGDTTFLEGVDQARLRADYQALTGRSFPSGPVPQPDPGRVPDSADKALARKAHEFHAGTIGGHAMDRALQRWLRVRDL
jgi:hypothetical protein